MSAKREWMTCVLASLCYRILNPPLQRWHGKRQKFKKGGGTTTGGKEQQLQSRNMYTFGQKYEHHLMAKNMSQMS